MGIENGVQAIALVGAVAYPWQGEAEDDVGDQAGRVEGDSKEDPSTHGAGAGGVGSILP